MHTFTEPAFWIVVLNLAFIAALPRIFFRRGTLNLRWWLTAAPFGVAGIGLLIGGMPVALTLPSGFTLAQPLAMALRTGGSTLAAGSIALIAYTLGTHRQRVSLWHQDNDMPATLVTWGAYARVRHPFYAAFLLTLLACVLVAPSWLTGAALLFGSVQLWRTARREEARLTREFGSSYVDYMKRTGRFTPRFRPSH